MHNVHAITCADAEKVYVCSRVLRECPTSEYGASACYAFISEDGACRDGKLKDSTVNY